MNYIISKEKLEKVINYIATKPFSEVYLLINELQTLQEQKEEVKEIK
jgi:hypothetical protein